MPDLTAQYWKKILEAMATRNRIRLGKERYLTLMTAIENGSDLQTLRKLAIDTAIVLGGIDGRRPAPQFESKPVAPKQTLPPKPSIPDIFVGVMTLSDPNRPGAQARHRPRRSRLS